MSIAEELAAREAYLEMVAQKISTLLFGDVIDQSSCASMLRVMKFFVYSITTTLRHPELHDKKRLNFV